MIKRISVFHCIHCSLIAPVFSHAPYVVAKFRVTLSEDVKYDDGHEKFVNFMASRPVANGRQNETDRVQYTGDKL